MGTNQGESSTQDNVVKKPFQMATPDNIKGNESGASVTAGLGATPITVNTHTTIDLNPGASSENRSAKWKTGSQDVGAGEGQYQ